MMLYGLNSILALIGVWRGSRASLGRSGVPLGDRVSPTGAQGAKTWFVGPSLASRNVGILWVNFCMCFYRERIKKHIEMFMHF